MILRIRHKGLRRLYESGSTAGIPADQADKIVRMLSALSVATQPSDIGFAKCKLHRLRGAQRERWAIHVTAYGRITFRFVERDVTDLDLEDDH